jgi:hypothetical protein
MNVQAAARALNRKAVEQRWDSLCDPTLAFSNSSYDGFLDIWRAKAGNRAMPKRSEMTPRDLKDFLRNIGIFERIGENPSSYLIRLIGTGLTQITGHVTGRTFEESVPPDFLPRYTESCDLVVDGGQPLRFVGRVHLNGHEYLDAEHLYVPLSNDNGQPAYVMGLFRYTLRRAETEESWASQIASIPAGLR